MQNSMQNREVVVRYLAVFILAAAIMPVSYNACAQSAQPADAASRLAALAQRTNALTQSAQGEDRLMYMSVTANAADIMRRVQNGELPQQTADALTGHLEAALADNKLTAAEASAWLDEAAAVTKTASPHDVCNVEAQCTPNASNVIKSTSRTSSHPDPDAQQQCAVTADDMAFCQSFCAQAGAQVSRCISVYAVNGR